MTALIHNKTTNTIEAIRCEYIHVTDEEIIVVRERYPNWRLPLYGYRLAGTTY